jgi:hypothetical protein
MLPTIRQSASQCLGKIQEDYANGLLAGLPWPCSRRFRRPQRLNRRLIHRIRHHQTAANPSNTGDRGEEQRRPANPQLDFAHFGEALCSSQTRVQKIPSCSMTPVPRGDKRTLPKSALVGSRIFFDLSVCGRVLHISERPTLLNQPSVQVLIGKVTYGERSPINVNAARCAVDFSARDVRRKLIACVDPASPMSTVRIEANLIRLGGVDPFETNLCRADSECVAVNDPWHA